MPNATNPIAVIVSLRPIVQPTWDAMSPITAVTIPIPRMLITKVGYPSSRSAFGKSQ